MSHFFTTSHPLKPAYNSTRVQLKRAAALAVMLFTATVTVHSQAALLALIFGDKVATENFHLSIDVGLNFAFIPGLESDRPVPGIHFGLGTFIKINERWALTPEFKPLSMRRSIGILPVVDMSNVITEPSYDLLLNYIDIPVLARYYVHPKAYISGGPQISFLMNAEQIGEGKLPSGETGTLSQNVEPTFNNIHWSFPIEFGYKLSTARDGKGLDFRARYSIGLSDVVNSSAASSRGGVLLLMLSFPFVEDPNKVVAPE